MKLRAAERTGLLKRVAPGKVAAALLALMTSACGWTERNLAGQIQDGAPPGCSEGVAQIRIGDGWSAILCGCKNEDDGTIVIAPQPLTCTVDVGTQVFFRFETSLTPHQIAPAPGAPFFPPSAPALPEEEDTQAAYPVRFTTPATFSYVDLFNSAIRGDIIVQ